MQSSLVTRISTHPSKVLESKVNIKINSFWISKELAKEVNSHFPSEWKYILIQLYCWINISNSLFPFSENFSLIPRAKSLNLAICVSRLLKKVFVWNFIIMESEDGILIKARYYLFFWSIVNLFWTFQGEKLLFFLQKLPHPLHCWL